MPAIFTMRHGSVLSLAAVMALLIITGSSAQAAPAKNPAAQPALDQIQSKADDSSQTNPSDPTALANQNDQGQVASQHQIHWGFNLGSAYQTRTDVDGGGNFAVTRNSGSGTLAMQLTDQLVLNVKAGFERHEFRFSSLTDMGNDPWENINIFAAQAALAYHLNQNWTIYATPLFNVSAEDGAKLSNAVTGGAAVGASYRFDDKFNIGFGLGVITRLEDSASVFPIISFNWQFHDQWVLRSGSFNLGVQGGAGVELEWQLCDQLALAAGVQYQVRRFRLDDHDIAPQGVGEERGVPLYLRATWQPCPNFTIAGFGGVLLGGRLKLEDENGDTITHKNFDPAFVFGARVGVQF